MIYKSRKMETKPFPKNVSSPNTENILVMSILYIAVGCLFETYLLWNEWTDLNNSFFVSSVMVRGRFKAKKFGFSKKKIRGFFCSQSRIILQNVNTTIGRSPETPDSGKAARG